MSRESRRSRKGTAVRWTDGRARRRATWYKVGGAAAFVAVLTFAALNRTDGGHHPTPRAELDHASHVVPASRYDAYPRVARTYEMVAAVPMIVDGIYCYCHCQGHSGHHSLLDCFASDHAARCDVCLSEAAIAYRMSREGRDLKAIRAEIDAHFRS